MSFPSYQKYKDSGVEWLGEVPEHWEVMPLKYVARFTSGGTPNKAVAEYWDGDVPWASSKDLKSETLSDTCDHITQAALDEGAAVLVPAGSVLVVVRGMILLHTFPVVQILVPMAINQDVKAVAPVDGVTAAYLPWLFRGSTTETFSRVDEAAHGTKVLRMESWTSIALPIPPHPEQSAIATFLERETAKIDALITEQRRLIELLQEKRQAVISHAVTKGLNRDAPMKDSGIEWLGEVPEHWTVAAVRFRYNVQLGKMLDANKITGKHLRPYLRVFDVQWGLINTDELPEMDFDSASRERFRLAVGDLLVNEGGSYPGRSAIWRGELDECYFQKALHRLRPCDPSVDTTQFFFYVMAWATSQGIFTAGGNESTIEHLPAEKFRKYRLAFPTMVEQLAIADFLYGSHLSLARLGHIPHIAPSTF